MFTFCCVKNYDNKKSISWHVNVSHFILNEFFNNKIFCSYISQQIKARKWFLFDIALPANLILITQCLINLVQNFIPGMQINAILYRKIEKGIKLIKHQPTTSIIILFFCDGIKKHVISKIENRLFWFLLWLLPEDIIYIQYFPESSLSVSRKLLKCILLFLFSQWRILIEFLSFVDNTSILICNIFFRLWSTMNDS